MAAEALLFDLDGTIWDSFPWYSSVLGNGRVGAGYEARLRRGESVVTLASRAGMTRTRFQRACADSAQGLALFPDVRSSLERLRGRAVPMGIVTALPRWLVEPVLAELDLLKYFPAAQYAARKPSPSPIVNALAQLDMHPSPSCYYVGDRDSDSKAAKNAGVSFAWASYGYGEGQPAYVQRVLTRFKEATSL